MFIGVAPYRAEYSRRFHQLRPVVEELQHSIFGNFIAGRFFESRDTVAFIPARFVAML